MGSVRSTEKRSNGEELVQRFKYFIERIGESITKTRKMGGERTRGIPAKWDL